VDSVGALVPFVLIIGAFYVLIIRPSRNRQKAQARLVDQLSVGARVMTTSGLYAQVAAIEEDGVVQLEVAPGVTMRWTKAAVARILPEPDAGDDTDDGDAEIHAADPDLHDADFHDPDLHDPDFDDAPNAHDSADAAAAAPDQESTERPT
jgi:preprotein translocase subunit YajC